MRLSVVLEGRCIGYTTILFSHSRSEQFLKQNTISKSYIVGMAGSNILFWPVMFTFLHVAIVAIFHDEKITGERKNRINRGYLVVLKGRKIG